MTVPLKLRLSARLAFSALVRCIAVALSAMVAAPAVLAQGAKLKVGIVLPHSGGFAPQGMAIENGFRLALQEQGGRLAGREVEFVRADEDPDPARVAEAAARLVNVDKIDVMLGPLGVASATAVAGVTRDSGTLHFLPAGGVAGLTGAQCAKNIFRTSYSYWQSGYAIGVEMSRRPRIKTMAFVAMRSAAGEEMVKGFRDGFVKGGGKIGRELWLASPVGEFKASLDELALSRPDAVFAAFTGATAVRFIREHAVSALTKTTPLVGSGFLSEGLLDAAGASASGIETALHYVDSMETPKNKAFRLAYVKAFKQQPDLNAVAGYDSAYLLAAGLKATRGDAARRAEIIAAIEKAPVDSPRGPWKLSRAHNPVQDHYLRRVLGTENRINGIAVRQLDDDPANSAACRMGG